MSKRRSSIKVPALQISGSGNKPSEGEPSKSGPKSGKLKAEYLTVLQALEIANRALQRVASLDEIIKALSPQEIEDLESVYKNDLSQAVIVILGQLLSKGIVFSPGKIGDQRYYGSVNTLNPDSSPLPKFLSRRQRVLILLRETVEALGRAVRIGDILDYAQKLPAYSDIEKVFITRSVMSLVETKEVKCVGTIRGDEKGIHLYLPLELDPISYWPKEPLTWLGIVENAFNELWERRKAKAKTEGRKLRPISTGEIRAHLTAMPSPHPNLKNPKLVVNAMLQLAKGDNTTIRKVEREGQRNLVWAPVSVPDNEIDLGDSYTSDAERAGEAVRRCVLRLSRPVNQKEIGEEISNDPALQPAGTSRLSELLSDIAKETIDSKNNTRRARVVRRVIRVGRVDGETYYYHDLSGLPQAQSYIRLRQIESRWEMEQVAKNLSTLDLCSAPSILAGRTLQITKLASQFLIEIDSLIEGGQLDTFSRTEAENLRAAIANIAEEASERLKSLNKEEMSLPAEVSLEIPGWTAEEFLPVIQPIYPRTQQIEVPHDLVKMLDSKGIRRFLNPKFESRFSSDPHMAAEYLYDRTDALLSIAKLWGGYECRLQATYARNELSLLRDPRFIYPAIDSENFHQRLVAVSCLAYLWSEEGNALLRRVAVNDPDYGIRQSALWAYAFAAGKKGMRLARERSTKDPEPRVREFAEKIIRPEETALWTM